jgi:hypothetical protein
MNAPTPTADLPLDGAGYPIGVDRNAGPAGVIYGAVLATAGEVRGHGYKFTLEDSSKPLVTIVNAETKGIRSNYDHAVEPVRAELGSFVGRVVGAHLSKAIRRDDGKPQVVDAVRGHVIGSPTTGAAPGGNRWEYLMSLVEDDQDALSVSLRVGLRYQQPAGRTGPTIAVPQYVLSADCVSWGAAVDGALGLGRIPELGIRQIRQAAFRARVATLTYDSRRDPQLYRVQRRARLLRQASGGIAGVSYPVTPKGKASAEEQQRVLAELRKVPRDLLDVWRSRGGRLDAIRGELSDHPALGEWRGLRILPPNYLGLTHGPWSIILLSRISSESDWGVVLHEVGHGLDYDGRISGSLTWRQTYANSLERARIPNEFRDPSEWWAEAFTRYYYSSATRESLGYLEQEQIGRLSRDLCEAR